MKEIINYQKLHKDLLKNLPSRTKDVIQRRFGLEGRERETLDAIGKSYGVCRERVRQIEETGINLLKKEIKSPSYQAVFTDLKKKLQEAGDLKREDLLLCRLTPQDFQNQTLFWLTLGDPFFRCPETEDLYPLWTISFDSLNLAKKVIADFEDMFETEKKLIPENQVFDVFKKEISPKTEVRPKAILSYLEVSKRIEQGPDGLFGLVDWPEISPRGIKDKAYLALKKAGKPLHFTQVAKAIDNLDICFKNSTLPQTVHNELIRDPRFILVGRGIYALNEWGYFPGQVKDVIVKVLKENKKPLSKDEILEKVLLQRLVKKNTVLLNLQNKKYFSKNPEGKYAIKEV